MSDRGRHYTEHSEGSSSNGAGDFGNFDRRLYHQPYTGRGTEGVRPDPGLRSVVRAEISYYGVDGVNADVEEKVQAFTRDYPRQAERLLNALRPIGREFQTARNNLDASPEGQAYRAYQVELQNNPYAPKSADVESYEAQKFELDVEQTARRLEKINEVGRSAERHAQESSSSSSRHRDRRRR